MVQAILSTDLAKHKDQINHFRRRIDFKKIKPEAKNGHLFLDLTSESTKFDT